MENLQLVSQYIKDLSFENYAAQKNQFEKNQLDLHIDLNIKKKILKTGHIEITLIVLLEAKKAKLKKFILELSYSSTFLLGKPKTDDETRKLSFIDCPNIMFPFVRQIIFSITRDSGFKPINLEHINFEDLFYKKKN